MAEAAAVLRELRANPLDVLQKYVFSPRKADVDGTATFYLVSQEADARWQDKFGKISIESQVPPRDKNSTSFQAFHVPAKRTSEIAGLRPNDPAVLSEAAIDPIPKAGRAPKLRFKVAMAPPAPVLGHTQTVWITPTVLGAAADTPDLMVTTQFQGCSFMFQKVGTALLCAHVWPNPPPSEFRLHSILMESGRFVGQPEASRPIVYGPNFYHGAVKGGWGAIVGVRKDGAWGLYHQLSDGRSNVYQALQIL